MKLLISSTTPVALPIRDTPLVIVVGVSKLGTPLLNHTSGREKWYTTGVCEASNRTRQKILVPWNFVDAPLVFFHQCPGKILVVDETPKPLTCGIVCRGWSCRTHLLVVCALWHATGTSHTSGMPLFGHTNNSLRNHLYQVPCHYTSLLLPPYILSLLSSFNAASTLDSPILAPPSMSTVDPNSASRWIHPS
jgi:hypothetical protein